MDVAQRSPLGWEHINLTGDYLWRSSAKIGAGKFRSLRTLPGKRCVLARRGRAGEKSEFFSILLRGELDEPQGVKILIEPSKVHQFSVGTGFHEAPFVQHKYPIGSLNGRQAVGDHKSCSALHEVF